MTVPLPVHTCQSHPEVPFQCFYCKWKSERTGKVEIRFLCPGIRKYPVCDPDLQNPTAGDPTSGIAVLDRAQSGVTTYCGYYTIPLNTEIVFNQGDRFSVVISFASPTNQTLYAFIDKSSSLESLHFVSSAEIGQSYYRTKANGWMDISYQQINNRIKAFTENTTEAATEILANVSALPKSSIRKIKSSRCSSYGFPGMRYSMQTAIRFSAALPERKATH